jgi:hypothetical protein
VGIVSPLIRSCIILQTILERLRKNAIYSAIYTALFTEIAILKAFSAASALKSHPDPATNTFFTIGHSTRSIAEFAGLLGESGVNLVIDVRSIPRSRTNPQFNQDSLPNALLGWQIAYHHIAELGGRRGKSHSATASPNGYWRVRSFANYADYALTAPFAAGLAQLREHGQRQRCAIMCAEAVWWRCHRRIIADYLLAAGEQVKHILGASHVEEASLTPGAVVRSDATVIYPAQDPPPTHSATA